MPQGLGPVTARTPRALEPLSETKNPNGRLSGWKILRESYLNNVMDNYNFDYRSPHAQALWKSKSEHIDAVKQDLLDQNRMDNLQYFTPLSIKSYPSLIASGLMDANPRQAQKAAKLINAATPWLHARDALLGEGGVLTHAKNYLHVTGGAEGLKFLRLMQSGDLSSDHVQVLMSVLRDPAGYVKLLSYDTTAAFQFATNYEKAHQSEYLDELGHPIMVPSGASTGVVGVGASANAPRQAGEWSAAFQAGLDEYNRQHSQRGITPEEWNSAINDFAAETGAQIDPNANRILFPNTDKSIDLKVAMGQLFGIGSQGAFATEIGKGLSFGERVAWDPKKEVLQPMLDVGNLALQAGAAPFMPLIEGYNAIHKKGAEIGIALQAKIQGVDAQDYEAFKKTQLASIIPNTNPIYLLQRATDAAARPIVAKLGLGEEGTQRYEQNVQLISGIFQVLLLKTTGDVARAREVATTWLPGMAEQQLGIGEGLKGYMKADPLASKLPGFLGEAATHPAFPTNWLRTLSYGVKRLVYDLSSKPLAQSVRTNPKFTNFYDLVDAVKSDASIPMEEKLGYLRKHFMAAGSEIPTEWLSRLLDPSVRTTVDMADVTLEYLSAPDMARLTEVTQRIKTIKDNLNDPATTDSVPQRMIDSWKAEIAQLSHEQGTILNHLDSPPLFRFPKESTMRAITTKTPITPMQKWLSSLYEPFSKTRALTQFTDSMPTTPELINPSLTDRPFDWAEHNADVIQSYLTKAGVPQDVITRLQTEAFELKNKTSQDFYNFVVKIYETIDAHLPASTPKELREYLTRMKKDNPLESRTDIYVTDSSISATGIHETSGRPVIPELVERPDGGHTVKSLPSIPSDFIKSVKLPSVDMLNEATSLYQRMIRANKPFRLTFGTLGKLMNLSTAVFKPLALAWRMPSVMTRVQFEQALRGMADSGFRGLMTTGGGIPIAGPLSITIAEKMGFDWRTMMDPRTWIFKPGDEMALGQIVGELGPLREHTMPYARDTGAYINGVTTPPGYVWNSLADTLIKLRSDWVSRTLMQQGPDVLFSRWAHEAGHTPLSANQMADLSMVLEELHKAAQSGALPELGIAPTDAALMKWYFERLDKAVTDMAGGHPEIIHGIRTGRLSGDIGVTGGAVHPVTGEPLGEYMDRLQSRLDGAREALKSLTEENRHLENGHAGEVRALRQTVKDTLEELQALEERVPEVGRTGHLPFESKAALSKRLEELWTNNEYVMPPTIEVRTRGTFEDATGIRENMGLWRKVQQDAWYAQKALSNLAYTPFQLLKWADEHGTRSSIYYQASRRYYDALIKRGYSPENAVAFAQELGAEYTRKLLYDLSERTSFHRTLKNVFWFAPAQMEMMGIWFDRLPRAYGAGLPAGFSHALGFTLGVAYYNAWLDVLRGAGLVTKDDKGDDAISMPWLRDFLEHAGLNLEGMNITTSLKGMNMVTNNPWPGMAIGPSFAIGAAGRRKILYMDRVAEWMTKNHLLFSEDVTAVPNAVNLFWQAATGHRLPLEFLSPDYSKYRYDKGMDQAIQFEYDSMTRAGDLPPLPEDYYVDGHLDQAKYEKARGDYLNRLLGGAQGRFQSISLVNALGSLGMPGPLYVTTKQRSDWMKFWDTVMSDGNITDSEAAQIDAYLGQHPNAMAYATYYSRYTGKEGQAIQATSPDGDGQSSWGQFFQNYFDKQKEIIPAEEYALMLMAVTSYAHYVGQRNTLLHDISPDLNPAELVSNGYQRSRANTQLGVNWGEWKHANPEANAVLTKARVNWAKEFGVPVNSYQAERLGDALTTLKDITAHVSEGGTKPVTDFKTVIGEMTQFFSKNGVFGHPNTSSERALSWYFEDVYIPWAKKTQALYDEARTLSEAGKDASGIYDQIKAINNSFTDAQLTYHADVWKQVKGLLGRDDNKWDGIVMPRPEEVTFGNKSPMEQQWWTISTATKPTIWLTDFQMEKAGVPDFAGRDELVSKLNDFEDYYYKILKDRNVAPGSTYADQLDAWRYQTEQAMAAQYGAEGTQLFQMNEALPIDRVVESGIAASQNPDVAWARATADMIAERLRSAGYSPAGTSQDAIYYKTLFYQDLVKRGALNPNTPLGRFLEQASYAIPDKGDEQRLGARLWEALFFGNRQSDYIPSELTALG